MKRKLTKRQRENQAIEAIIAGCLHGWGDKEWREVFKRMDEKAISSGCITKRSHLDKPWDQSA